MRDTVVVMKDGRKFANPLYLYRPKEGYLTLMIDPGPDVKLYFRDMVECGTPNQRISGSRLNDYDDILARAREDGWDEI